MEFDAAFRAEQRGPDGAADVKIKPERAPVGCDADKAGPRRAAATDNSAGLYPVDHISRMRAVRQKHGQPGHHHDPNERHRLSLVKSSKGLRGGPGTDPPTGAARRRRLWQAPS